MTTKTETKQSDNQKKEQILSKFMSGDAEYQFKDWTANDGIRLRQIKRFYDDPKTGKRKSSNFSFPVKFQEVMASRLENLLETPELPEPEEGKLYTMLPIGEKIMFSNNLACQVFKIRGHKNRLAHLRLLRVSVDGKAFLTKKKFKILESDVLAVANGILVPGSLPVPSEEAV